MRPEFDAGRNYFSFLSQQLRLSYQLAASKVSSRRVIFCHRANISFVDLRKSVANVTGDLSSVTLSNSEGRRCMKCPALENRRCLTLRQNWARSCRASRVACLRRRPITIEFDWTEMPLPSLRGALATKQSRGRVMRPLDCFAALAMTTGELAPIISGRRLAS